MACLQKNVALMLMLLPITSALIISKHPAQSADAQKKLRERPALLEKSAQANQDQHSTKFLPLAGAFTANWFGGFAQGESTYDFDGTQAGHKENPALDYVDGWYPEEEKAFEADHEVRPAKFFEETISGGRNDAFQSYYPPQKSNIAGSRVPVGEFYTNKGGVARQEYRGSGLSHLASKVPAGWFDGMAAQRDGFGRHELPAPESPLAFVSWKEHSVNSTMFCKTPGCTAKINLQTPFNFKTDGYAQCRLTMFFHPTDFDDQYAGEAVEYIMVNNRRVSNDCRPHVAGGCNELAKRPLIPCVQDFPIDHLIKDSPDLKGILSIEAKINKNVDECPYQGNLLSAVPVVTCLVNEKPKPLINLPVKAPWNNGNCVSRMRLRCMERGCKAPIRMPIDPSCIDKHKCTLDLQITPTDFDNLDNNTEFIEYISVDGARIASNLNPGVNPCRTSVSTGLINQGLSLWINRQSKYSWTAVKDMPITVPATGSVVVEAKITDQVDECASDGYLLDAIAQVTCKGEKQNPVPHLHKVPPKKKEADPPKKKEADGE